MLSWEEIWMEDAFDDLVNDEIFEAAIDVMWLVRSKQIGLNELYHVQPLPVYYGSHHIVEDDQGPLPLPIPAPLQPISSIRPVVCNICGKDVAGSRFAVHLERCMNGGKRSNRRHYEVLGGDDLRKAKKEIVDPFPQSMVVRVKVRAGVPAGNKHRIGASLEEFTALKSGAGAS